MKRSLTVFAALAFSLMDSAFVASLKASEWDKKTIITISQPVAVEGATLPAGRYLLRLPDSSSNPHVVDIFNVEETRLIATVLAIPAYRLQPTGKNDFSFYDSPVGPPALHTWFRPGDNSGFEFLRPQITVAAKSKPSLAGN